MFTHKLATLAYIIHKEEILLLYRNKKKEDFHAGKFIGIGGRLEPGETPLECILREIKEETGYELSTEEISFRGYIFFDEITRLSSGKNFPAFNWLVFLYTTVVEEKKIISNVEGELKWFSIKDIPYEKMWQGDRLFTPKLLETADIIEGKFLYRSDNIESWTFGLY